MKQRRGASLIELLVVMAMISTILMVTGPLFYRLFQVDQLSARAALMEITTSRLAIQFRRDVHEAQTATRRADEATGRGTLELHSGSHSRIVYTADLEQVRRDVIAADRVTSRENFRLPGCRVEFPESDPEVADATRPANTAQARLAPALVTLAIERPHSPLSGSNHPARTRKLTLDAELGRDRRLAAHPSPAAAKLPEEQK